MVTLRDVARDAGVSTATASRALGGSASVSVTTRERVQGVAAKLGYSGNALARSLRTQRTDTIGLLLPDVRNPFFTELAYHVDKAAAERGLTVMIGNADESTTAQNRYLEALERHRVDGIIAVPQGESTEVLARVAGVTPTVFIDRDPGIPGTITVTSDNRGGMFALVDHVVAMGHRKVGIVAGPQCTSTGRERLSAMLDRLRRHGIHVDDTNIVEGDFGLDSGVSATEVLLGRGSVDAIVAADNLMALGALMVLRRSGLRVGRDVALACVDDIDWFSLVDPPVTVVAQDIRAMGRAAVERLIGKICGTASGPVVVPMRLIARQSCGEAAADAINETQAGGTTPGVDAHLKEENHG